MLESFGCLGVLGRLPPEHEDLQRRGAQVEDALLMRKFCNEDALHRSFVMRMHCIGTPNQPWSPILH